MMKLAAHEAECTLEILCRTADMSSSCILVERFPVTAWRKRGTREHNTMIQYLYELLETARNMCRVSVISDMFSLQRGTLLQAVGTSQSETGERELLAVNRKHTQPEIRNENSNEYGRPLRRSRKDRFLLFFCRKRGIFRHCREFRDAIPSGN